MTAAMVETDLRLDANRLEAGRKPGDTDRHRQQRGKNLIMFAALIAMVAIFFALTIVRMDSKL